MLPQLRRPAVLAVDRRGARNILIARPWLSYRQPDRRRNRTYGAQPPAQLLLAADLRHQPRRALSTRAAGVTSCDIPTLQLGLHSSEKLPAAEPARPASPPRPRPRAEDQPDLALERGVPGLLAAAVRPARTRLTSHPCPYDPEGGLPGAVGAGAPEHIGPSAIRREHLNQIPPPKNRPNTISN
jgi:hypothetical protein